MQQCGADLSQLVFIAAEPVNAARLSSVGASVGVEAGLQQLGHSLFSGEELLSSIR